MYQAGQITRKQAKRQGLVLVDVKKIGGVMVLFMVKLGYGNMTPLQKVSKSEYIVSKMTGNPNFPTPVPSLADVTIASDALKLAQNSLDGSKEKTNTRNLREKELDSIMKSLQNYVEFIANGNTEIILSSGFDVNEVKNPIGLLPFPADFTAVNTPVAGQIKLKWKAVKKRLEYTIQYSLNIEDSTQTVTVNCSKTNLLLTDLPSDARFQFRIATNSSAGNGGFSPWISCRPN